MQMQGFPGSPLTRLPAAGEDYSGCVKTIIWIPRGEKCHPLCPQITALVGLLTAEPQGVCVAWLHTPLSLVLDSAPDSPGMVHACDENSFAHWQQVWAVLCCWSLCMVLALLPSHTTHGAEGKCSGRGLNLDFYPSENFVISADVMCSKAVKSLLFIGEKRKMDLLISVQKIQFIFVFSFNSILQDFNSFCLQLISG